MSLNTKTTPTWCPGCFNFQILEGVKKALERIKGESAIVSGIGCHAKIFDYINLPGINTLHGRVLPTCLGLKIARPDLNVFGFSGDGDAYAEGMGHLIHAARYNSNFTYIVHNNQVFALTVGQPTPTTPLNFKDKTTPKGVKISPINPIKLMLSAGATFVARVSSEIKQIEQILGEAQKHKGFAFIEVIQPCIIFQRQTEYKKEMYELEKDYNKTDWNAAMEKAGEFNYDNIDKKTKIPLGIFYQKEKPIFEECINL